jgi:hypothetical protein
MKYLKRFNESIEDIDSICKKYGIINYTVNPDGTVDVDGHVDLNNKKLTILPLKFGKVSGSFGCSNNQLTTLEYSPTSVGGHFYCNNNQLTTLEGCPKTVGGNFWCQDNQLTTLEGCPKTVGGNFWSHNNKLTIINWNDVYTLNSTDFDLEDNPIYEIYKIFPDFKTFIDSLEWNYFKEPNIIIRNKFVEACEILSEETGESITIPEKIKGYIFE